MGFSDPLVNMVADSLAPVGPPAPGAGQRRESRLSVIGLGVIVLFGGRAGDAGVRAGVRDVSGGGVGLVLAEPIRAGAQFVLCLPPGEFLNTAGVLYVARGSSTLARGGYATGAILLAPIRASAGDARQAAPAAVELAALFRRQALAALRPDERGTYAELERRLAPPLPPRPAMAKAA